MTDELIVRREGAVGRLTLNRPAALGALTLGMCQAMTAALLEWRGDPAVKAVLIDHEGPRGFCAGGDIRMLADSAAVGGAAAFEFFHTEYRLNHLMAVYETPIVTVMDGVTMGGGVGLAMPSTYRIATERTRFAMPETGIGLFPDVGAGWYLPRLPAGVGTWVALTGERLKPAACVQLGIATHFVPESRLPAFRSDIATLELQRALMKHSRVKRETDELDLQRIARTFDFTSIEEILSTLKAYGSVWAIGQFKSILNKSPMSSKAAIRLLQEGREANTLAEDLKLEFRLAVRLIKRHDFLEGVRATIVDRDNSPRWSPAGFTGISDSALDELFAPLPPGEEWSPLPETQGD